MDQTRRNIIVAGSFLGAVFLAPILPAACNLMGIKGRDYGVDHTPPKRPAGTPAPMIEEDIRPILARLDVWLAAHPKVPVTLNPPADEAALDALEAQVGRKLPGSFRQLYRWHDGETLEESHWGVLFGTEFLSLARIKGEHDVSKQVIAEYPSRGYDQFNKSWPNGAIDPLYISPYWLTIGADGSGNSIGIDLDPWPKGRVGQIILFGRDQFMKAVLFPSLGSYLTWFVEQLEAGNWTIEDRGQTPHLALPEAVGNHIFEALRKMVGAPTQFST